MAMASRESVTVSIAAATIGIFRAILFERHVRVYACAGRTDDLPGSSSTSSNVSASGMFPSIIMSPVRVHWPHKQKNPALALGVAGLQLSKNTVINHSQFYSVP